MATPSARRPLVLAPFRGLRFDEDRVGDLATVISPPYDVLDADIVRDLEAANRRNIVRLILSRSFQRPYEAVARRLQQWRQKGYLRADPDPALYLYQYTVDDQTVRGLVGLVELRAEADRVILPHEDVMPGPVADRCALMRTTAANLEPILLVHEGTDRLRDLLTQVADGRPLAEFSAPDGSHHVLWAITDPHCQRLVATELEHFPALIADGHHRYAAYQLLQQELRDPSASPGESPWDFGLAMLVDQRGHPLTVGPIHRSVTGLTMSDVRELCGEHEDRLVPHTSREAALQALERRAEDPDRAWFAVSDARTWALLGTRRVSAVDARVLHDRLLPAWGVAEEQLGYHHSVDQALHTVVRAPGVVVAMNPPSLPLVMESAREGLRMPRKSTSFTPKPRMGVVMRDLRDA